MGTGKKFQNERSPRAVVKVGAKEGEKGTMEIIGMLFTVKGPTAGAILMEWNVHEDKQGSGKITPKATLRVCAAPEYSG